MGPCLWVSLVLCAGIATAQRDCFPWPGVTRSACEARGCIYTSGDPNQCTFDDGVCPSDMGEQNRIPCLEGEENRDDCLKETDCAWCETTTPGIPWCFYDDSVNQGGRACPVDYPINERVDCQPESHSANPDPEACVARGCYWCSTGTSAPSCFVPAEHGYRMVGQPEETGKGYRVIIRRINYPSWFGSDANVVQVDIEFQADERLRIKLSDPNAGRWEVPLPIDSHDEAARNPLYAIQFKNDPVFSVSVIRKSTGAVM
ncbi:hypothetical protein CAPTEDRAFT_200669 [Capitella teleta]|uniref:P-type domain-containing protein n=1 Tax=Capitella teleta TaxID=283909 RepID=R7V6K1_CAPTE|nr:hypothetical protein CAPTEDRAFT_200669 [Capitella teleta]|eukprot:ELU14503.1 hypothetical protein CAPTEDRAFT_200669 [Capitella teleta]